MLKTNVAPLVTPRIAYVLKRFPRLSETFILNELLELQRQGMQVEVFSLLRPPQEQRHALLGSLQVPVTYLPSRRTLGGTTIMRGQAGEEPVKRTLEECFDAAPMPFAELFPGKEPAEAAHLVQQASVLASLVSARGIRHMHAHFGSNATTVALLASRLSGVPFSFTAHARDIYHTYVDPETDDALRRRKIREAAFVITVSEFNREHLSTLAGTRDARKVHRVYNGIDLQRFRPSERPRRDDLFLAIGRLIEKKGFTHLVEACRLLSDRGREFRCVVVGDGPDEEALRAQIRDADLERTVQLVGAVTQEQVVELMSEATATVLPCVVSGSGDRDGLPTVLLEALGSGLPAISTRVTGVPEIIDHDICGLLVPPADPAGLAEAMDRMLGNPELRDRFAVAARAKAERDFDLRCSVVRLRRRFLDSAAQRPLRHEEHANAHRVRVG